MTQVRLQNLEEIKEIKGDLMRCWAWRKQWFRWQKANGVRWYRHVLRRNGEHILRKTLEFEKKGKRKRGRPKKTWKMQVEKESKSVG